MLEPNRMDPSDTTPADVTADQKLGSEAPTCVVSLAATLPGGLADTELPPGTAVGRYLVLHAVGAGGMGVVYAAYDPELDRKIALKLIRPGADGSGGSSEDRARLLREAQAMAKLAHPNVVAVFDAGPFGDQTFVAMEFVEGTTLRKWMGDRPRSWKEVRRVFLAAGRGLAAAHAVGLVHRDFKPENVLIGNDGRVRVADFGLARSTAATRESEEITVTQALAEAREAVGRGLLSTPLTRTGNMVGTPAYMAPEQFLALGIDARSDQYAFCVALHEALYGEHPFPGDSPLTLALQVSKGEVRPPSPDGRVPPWLRRVLLRGLAAEPGSRFPTMESLLAALDRDPRRRLRRWTVGTVVAGALVAVLASYALGREQRSAICRGAERKLEGIWDHDRQGAVRRSFLSTGKSYAEDAWRGTERLLHAYAQGWVAMHTEACEAARLRGELSEELLDLRIRCLGRRLKELRALTDLFAAADATVVESAVQAAGAVTPLGECADVDALSAQARPPADPRARAIAAQLGNELARVKALGDAGKYREGLLVARQASAEARALRHRPLLARALLLQGELEDRNGDFRTARGTLHEALYAGQAGRDDRAAAQAANQLTWIVGHRLADYERGHEWARLAGAILERIGGDELLEAHRLGHLGAVLVRQGRHQPALDCYQSSLTLLRKIHGPEHPAVATALNNLGVLSRHRAMLPDALRYYQGALDIREKLLGPGHPQVAVSLSNIASVLEEMGALRAALENYGRALRIQEGALGPDHPALADTLNNLAVAHLRGGQEEEAERHFRRALAGYEKAQGPLDPDVAGTLVNLGILLERRGRSSEAMANYTRAVAICEKRLGPAHLDVALPLRSQGALLLSQGRTSEAMQRFQRALTIRESSLGRDHPSVADSLADVAEAHLAQRQPTRATVLLERALAIHQAQPGDPALLARSRFALARALSISGPVRGRSRQLALEARADYARAGSFYRREIQAIDAWLASGGGR
jgi:tetratricopeptide (TPR) repeat protein